MLENYSLVCEAKHDAGFMHEAVSVFAGWVRFGKSSVSLGKVVARLFQRSVASAFRRFGSLAVLLLASLGTFRSQGKAQFFVLARFAFFLSASFKFWLVVLGLLRASRQSKPPLFELAAKIVWPVPSLQRAGITSRSTGLPSAAR